MASTVKQRLRRFNGTDYDTVHLETDTDNVLVEEYSSSPLNTDQFALGQNDVYFKVYPDIKWQVQHLDGDYAYLALTKITEKTSFGSNQIYKGSTIAAKCTDFLNNTIPIISQYLENVTVNGVTNKVFIPNYLMFSGTSAPGDSGGPKFDWPSASQANRVCNYQGAASAYWLCSMYGQGYGYVRYVNSNGSFVDYGSPTGGQVGFRPCVKVKYKNWPVIKADKTLTEVLASIDGGEKVANISGTVSPGNIVDWAGYTWLVMHTSGNYAYLIHNDIIENTLYTYSGYSGEYLGSTIHNKCLAFQDSIDDKYLQCCQTVMGSYVFIPSYDQLNMDFTYMTTAANRIAKLNGSATSWWTCSSYGPQHWFVHSAGTFNNTNPSQYSYGFRPAVKVRYK